MKGEQRGEGRGIDYGLGVRLAVTGEGEIVSEINDDYNHHNPPPLSTITKTQNQPTNHNYHRESDRKKKKGKKKKKKIKKERGEVWNYKTSTEFLLKEKVWNKIVVKWTHKSERGKIKGRGEDVGEERRREREEEVTEDKEQAEKERRKK